jgi:hypothetical protein
LVASALDALGLIICDTLTYQMGVLDDYDESQRLKKVSLFSYVVDPRTVSPLGTTGSQLHRFATGRNPSADSIQISFASNYFYDFGMGFPKLSMLAFYWAFFDLEAQPKMRKMLWGMTAFVVACYLTILFDDTFFCGGNVSVQWSMEEGACSVFYAPEPFILNFTLNLACYLVCYAVPLILLAQGILKKSTGVTVTFILGALTIASGIVRFSALKIGTGQENLVCKLLPPHPPPRFRTNMLFSQTPSAWLR